MHASIKNTLHFITFAVTVIISSPSKGADNSPFLLAELDQGWTVKDRRAWYSATQGSRLIPETWLRALEQEDSDKLFLDPANIASFGYIPDGVSGLPVGFAIDNSPDSSLTRTKLRSFSNPNKSLNWVGMNCAACHTSDITYKGKSLRIDGGQAFSDYQSFMASLNKALFETRASADKFDRFSKKVLGKYDNIDNRLSLKEALDGLIKWQHAESKANDTKIQYGPGRVDAFGHIFNKVILILNSDISSSENGKRLFNAPDAPVSYPFIWRAPQLDRVQYNGIAKNSKLGDVPIGSLGRNVGEVTGVFGDVVAHVNPNPLNGFSSSVNINNLFWLENKLTQLRPPKWPISIFGPINVENEKTGARRGESLFKQNCIECHKTIDRKDTNTPINVIDNVFKDKNSPGTDIWMACNAFTYKGPSGVLQGYNGFLTDYKPLGAEEPVVRLLEVTVGSILYDQKMELVKEATRNIFGIPPSVEIVKPEAMLEAPLRRSAEKQERFKKCQNTRDMLLNYTSRPLNGVWATAPYLHNGSVPTIYDLLLPADKRPTTFQIGYREYDPVKMGIITSGTENKFKFTVADEIGDIDGNSNKGHDYGNAKLSDDDRYAIIEYLKWIDSK